MEAAGAGHVSRLLNWGALPVIGAYLLCMQHPRYSGDGDGGDDGYDDGDGDDGDGDHGDGENGNV